MITDGHRFKGNKQHKPKIKAHTPDSWIQVGSKQDVLFVVYRSVRKT